MFCKCMSEISVERRKRKYRYMNGIITGILTPNGNSAEYLASELDENE